MRIQKLMKERTGGGGNHGVAAVGINIPYLTVPGAVKVLLLFK